ncbi:Ig-like domain repeat protein [Isoptericola sp. b408]|uniref:Ig-like domain repeat protein n=1 Tax=Isoptericola sp. b408 TaxID=3064653 RepID=UPI0027123A85|nr:Ig-like domain repeat protein [Isoptericola sp. b408]MDO8149939.1 Ig-like domain repeat protein [Isoptericola sp. b408]
MTSGFTALTRTVAMAVAIALGLLTMLVVPASAADDEREASVVVVEQDTNFVWRPAGGFVLDVRVTDEGGRSIGGPIEVLVDGEVVERRRQPSYELGVNPPPSLPGPHEVTVRFLGDPAYLPAEWTGTLDVVEGDVSAVMTVDAPEQAAHHEGATFTVDVATPSDPLVDDPDQPDGRAVVTWDDPAMGLQDAPVREGSGAVPVPTQIPGEHAYEVTFYSYGDVQITRASGTLTIGKAGLPLKVWSDDAHDGVVNTARGAWEVAVSTNASWSVDGTVSLYDGDRLLRTRDAVGIESSAAVFTLAADEVPAGHRTLTARLTGSPFVEDASATLDLEVVRNPAVIGVERATARTFQWGRPHKLRVAVHSADNYWPDAVPTGTVKVYRGTTRVGTGTLDDSGEVVVRIWGKKLPVGRTTLRVVYTGDTVYEKTVRYRTVRVYKARTKLRASILDTTVHRPQQVKVRFRLSSPSNVALTGKVKLKVDGVTVKTVRLRKKHDGARTVSLPASVEPGHHYLKVVYVGTATKKRSVKVPLYFTVS